MNKETTRKIADALTWSRVISVVPITLLAWYGLKWWVFSIYIAAALTDFFDGFLHAEQRCHRPTWTSMASQTCY